MTHPLSVAAAEYLGRGLAVIALTGKMPNGLVHRSGLHAAIMGPVEDAADWDLLAGAFEHPDTTGIGIVIPYPYVVVDVDGEEGAVQFQEMVYNDVFDEPRWVASTPRLPNGGLHFWFACSEPTGSMKLGSKLDLKGQNSYVVAPPSLHPDGGTYEWVLAPGEEPPMEAPAAILKAIEDHNFDIAMATASKATFAQRFGPRYQPGDTKFFAQANHDALIAGMSTAEDGNRNNYLHWAASVLDEEGGQEEEFNQLAEAALAVGLEPVEVKRTLRSARARRG